MKKNWLLFLFSILVCFYLLEGLMSLFLKKSIMLYYIPPHSEQRHSTQDFDVIYRYNNYALRGEDIDFNNKFDIVLLGDSFLFGMGVDEKYIVSNLLKDRKIDALNLSEAATNPINYYHKFVIAQKLGLKAKNLVLCLYIGNDFQGIGDKDNLENTLKNADKYLTYKYDIVSYGKLERLRYLAYAAIHKLFYKNEFIIHEFERAKPFKYDWLVWFAGRDVDNADEMQKRRNSPWSGDKYLSKKHINEKSIKNTAIIINHLRRRLNSETKLSVMLIPDWHYGRHDLGAKYKYLINNFTLLLNRNIKIIDLHDRFNEDIFLPQDAHWNEKGHKFVAEVLINELNLAVNGQ